jgi:hypothetical protein
VVIGDKVEAVVFVGGSKVGSKGVGGVGVALPLGGAGPGAEGAFYGWFGDQPLTRVLRPTGSWFVRTA